MQFIAKIAIFYSVVVWANYIIFVDGFRDDGSKTLKENFRTEAPLELENRGRRQSSSRTRSSIKSSNQNQLISNDKGDTLFFDTNINLIKVVLLFYSHIVEIKWSSIIYS